MDAAKLEEVLQRQAVIADEINTLFTNHKKQSTDRDSEKYIKDRIVWLNEFWDEFKENHKLLLPQRNDTQPYFVKDTYASTQKMYNEMSIMLGKRLAAVLAAEDDEENDGTDDEENKKEMDDLKSALKISEIHLTDLFSDINKMELTTESLGTLEMRAEELKSLYSEWKTNFNTVQRFNVDEYDKKTYDKQHKKFITLCSKLQDAMNVARNANLGATNTKVKVTADLPKIKIADFDGNITKWKVFYELYDQVIHQNTTLGNAAKMHFLKTYVKGEAARLINHLTPTAENYESAYKILIARYENTRVLLGKLLDTLLDLPILTNESCAQLKSMHDSVYECLKAIENLNVPTENWDALITHILVKKLDNETRKSYECQLKQPKEVQKVDELLKFIESRFMALETYEQKEVLTVNQNKNTPQQKKEKRNAFQATCTYCGGQHSTSKCDSFLKLSDQERVNTAREKKWCLNCLRDNHRTNECKCKYSCDKCKKSHNTILHLENNKQNEKSGKKSENTNSKSNVQSMVANNKIGVLLATAVINVHGLHGTPILLRALIDQGSQSAFITENAAQMLALPRTRTNATISGIGDQTKNAKHSIRITITPRIASSFILYTNAIILDKLSTRTSGAHNANEWSHINQLQLADPAYCDDNQIDVLLGAAEYAKIIKNGLIKGEPDTPIAQNTELGWIVSGMLKNKSNMNVQAMVSTAEVDEFLRKFWEINEITGRTQHTPEEQECEEIFEKTHQRLASGKYVVKLPLKNNEVELGQTRNMAVATFLQLEKKFARNSNYFDQYKKFIDEYIELGHMIETNEEAKIINYLPHHAVFKESSTTKIRVVFDASRKSSNHKSLNDNLMVGPTLQQDMSAIIMRWRKHKIAFTADIEKMYRQIWVNDEHTNLQRIIWRNTPKEKLREYKLLTVTYGTSCAPYLAIKTLQQLAHDEQSNSPEAAKIILSDFYVDDIASGADDVEHAKWLQCEIRNTLARGGFNLRKWASNSTELLNSIPECDREVQVQHDIIIDASATVKALGVKWNACTDTFGFKITISEGNTRTKRELLSEIASLFDPLGWLAPVIIKAKILIQEAWAAGITWDENLPNAIRDNWAKIKCELPLIEQIEIPRWINTHANTKIQLHGFCDASEDAYAAVIYIRTVDADEKINVTLLTAKTKVAPLKKEKLTIPRLELCGATLLANLMQQVVNSMQFDIEDIFLWCDSKVVLAWIKGNPHKWKTFVANRAIEINGKFRANKWNYVQTKLNPADCASRGIFPAELKNHELWWNGPKWLHEQTMNMQNEYETTTLEEKVIASNIACVADSILPSRDSYSSLQLIVACCLRFIHNCRQKEKRRGRITAAEYNNASDTIAYIVQHECFAEEIRAVQNGNELKCSKIKKLNPFIDDCGLLRVGGRLTHSDLEFNAKHQLLMPYDHFVTDLIIKRTHMNTMHGGPMLTEAQIRQQYWIIKGYRRIKTIIYKCEICRRFSRTRMQQYMGDLPRNRVTGIRAFINCGVDYAGPIAVRTTKGRGYKSTKGYIAVFICLATKAIHLECASDMTAETFLAAFRRFTARRGTVANMYSDNGTNFVKANTLLQCKSRDEEDEFNNTVFSAIRKTGTQWHFIPPASPNFGGLWEAGVKSVKTHMKKSIGDSTLTFEELSTLLYQIEATLNSRPLCALSADANDTAVLTPGHFLIGEPLLSPPESNFMDINANRLTRWQLIQKMHQNFWKKWSTEYLNRLQERPKWLKKIKEPEINDLVLMKEDYLPAARWAAGRVIKKHPGQDGLTRVVEIKIDEKIYKRPLSKICLMPSSDDNAPKPSDMNEISVNMASVEHNEEDSAVPKRKKRKKKKKDKERKEPRRRPRNSNNLWILAMMMAYWHSNALPIAALSGIEITPFTSHPGIYFENRGAAYLSNTKWSILAYYDLRQYWAELHGIRTSIKGLRAACTDLTTNRTDYLDNVKLLEDHYTEIDEKNQIIAPNGRRRQKRATLNFVGNLLGDIFGILDSNFAEEYAKDLGKIKANEEHLLLLMRNHTTITETTLNIVKRNEDAIVNQTRRINEMINDIGNLSNEQERVFHIMNTIFRISIALTKYESTQTNILNILLDVHNKQVNTNVLSPEQLKLQLQGIHSTVDASILVPGEDAHGELKSLYSTMSIQATTLHEQLVFKITLPLVMNEQFQVFKLLAVPTRQDERYIWVEPSTQFILTTVRRNYYYPISERELDKCALYGNGAIICERKRQMYGSSTSQIGCEIQLLNHGSELNGNCTLRATAIEDTWIALSEPNKWIYVIYNTKQMDVICNDDIEHLPIEGEGIIRLHPHCVIRHSSVEITAQNNYESAIPGSILPEINITMEIAKYKQKYDATPLSFRRSNISTLNEMIEATKNNEKQLPETLDIHDIHHYGLGYALVLGIICYIIFSFIRRRQQGQKDLPVEMTSTRAARAISMPDLGRENV